LDLRYQVLIHGLRDLGLVDEQRGVEMIVMRLCHLNMLLEGDKALPKSQSVQKSTTENNLNAVQPEELVPQQAKMVKAVVIAAPVVESTAAEEIKEVAASYEGWEEAVAAYSHVRPGVTAMLERVICIEYQASQVRLALDAHQQRAIVPQERKAFETWLGRDVLWENKVQGGHVETISTVRSRHADEEKKRVWQQAEQDPAVQLLKQEMDCRLLDVQPAAKESGVNER